MPSASPAPRAMQGIAACSIAWGAWGGAGMAAGDAAVAARLQRLGVVAIQPAPGLAALEQAVSLSVAAGGGTVMAAGLAWNRLLVGGRQHKPFYAEFAAVAAAAAGQDGPNAAENRAAALPAANSSAASVQSGATAPSSLPAWHALDPAQRTTFFASQITALVEAAVGRPVGASEALMAAGLDSLGECAALFSGVRVSLRCWGRQLESSLPVSPGLHWNASLGFA